MKTNAAKAKLPKLKTAEGGVADRVDAYRQLKRRVMGCMLWEDSFYSDGYGIANSITDLVKQVKPEKVAELAITARDKMQLRHVPLFLVNELSKIPGTGKLVTSTLDHVIQRADEIAEFLSIYWKGRPDGRGPISWPVRRGLASAFGKFDEYKLGKYKAEAKALSLADVMRLVHPVAANEEQNELFRKVRRGELKTPVTWETELSAGKDKKETFERLMREGNLGGMALLRNLRGMLEAGVNNDLIRERLKKGAGRALPFRFITAARYAPMLEDVIEESMLKAIQGMDKLPGKTGLLIDKSGSMSATVSSKSEVTRLDAACGLAILCRDLAEDVKIATFNSSTTDVPPRRGFALRDSIGKPNGGTELGKALRSLESHWSDRDRVIVITDEQSHDSVGKPWAKNSYVINIGVEKNGVGSNQGWTHIDGWSEAVFDYIRESEVVESDD